MSRLAEAQRLGYAEPDPSSDIDGIDAAQKLVVLLQHFAHVNVRTEAIETGGIRDIGSAEIDQRSGIRWRAQAGDLRRLEWAASGFQRHGLHPQGPSARWSRWC